MTLPMKVLFFINDDKALLKQRLNFVQYLQQKGHEVHIASTKSPLTPHIMDLGFEYHDIGLSRSGMNPFSEFGVINNVIKVINKIKPDVIHNTSIKPVIYGTIAGRLCNVPKIINLLNGLGFAFTGEGFKSKLIQFFTKKVYRILFKGKNVNVIVQNSGDEKFLKEEICKQEIVHLIRGSGVDMEKFKFSPKPRGEVFNFLYVGRLIKTKGINDLIVASEELLKKRKDFKVTILGDLDPQNPLSLKKEVVERLQSSPNYNFIGFNDDIREHLNDADCVILPSYHKEGLPLSLLEAASVGRAIISTTTPGCADICRDGVNGFVVPPKSPEKIEVAMENILNLNEQELNRLGVRSRILIEENFKKEIINDQTYSLYTSTSKP